MPSRFSFMLVNLLWVSLVLVGGFVLLRTLGVLLFKRYIAWETENRRGLRYYGKSLSERQAFKQKIKSRTAFLIPFLWLETKLQRKAPEIPSFEYEGVTGPSYSCTAESFHAAATYGPKAEDIFVATQMKCGTTWMQQIVFEILHKGRGDLADSGYGHLYAASPWIEAVDGVSMESAPLLGASRRRLIKTHLPPRLCPYSESAKYLYVTRHPVSCFASVLDYFQLMTGFLAPPTPQLLDWYCSDKMWWRSWPEHVAGWWEWAEARDNVLFFHFEEMKKDLAPVIRKVAQFLGEELSEEQIQKVVHKSGFQVMKEKEELFEMSPPNLFSVSGTYFKSGQIDRHKVISEGDKKKILTFCRDRLRGTALKGSGLKFEEDCYGSTS